MDRIQRDREETLPKFGNRVRTKVKKGGAIATPDWSCIDAEAQGHGCLLHTGARRHVEKIA